MPNIQLNDRVATWLNVSALVAVFIFGFIFAQTFLLGKERDQVYYQSYYTPAVMQTCGYGFTQPKEPIPALNDFLQLKRLSFSCDEIPTDVKTEKNLLMRNWYYKLSMMSVTWRIFGISWTSAHYLISFLFSVTILFTFLLSRLAMGTFFSLLVTIAFSVTLNHYQYLMTLRDYSKTPFLFGLLWLTGLLVSKKRTKKQIFLILAGIGLFAGIGYGFRPDILIIFPFLCLTLVLFLPEGIRNYKIAVAYFSWALCIFFVSSAFIWLYTDHSVGSAYWHFVLLGLGTNFLQTLHIFSPMYDMGSYYNDMYMALVTQFHGSKFLGLDNAIYVNKSYDIASRDLYLSYFKIFPADFFIHAYASIRKILHHYTLIKPWNVFEFRFYPHGILTSILLFSYLSIKSPRKAFFILFLLLYFLGYPGMVFLERHYFPVIFWNYWVVGVIASWFFCQFSSIDTGKKTMNNILKIFKKPGILVQPSLRIGLMLSIALMIVLLPLLIVQFIQQQQMKQLISSFLAAKTRPVSVAKKASGKNHLEFIWGEDAVIPYGKLHDQFSLKTLLIEFDSQRCTAKTINMKLLYDFSNPIYDFSRDYKIPLGAQQKTKLFASVFGGGGMLRPKGLLLNKEDADCLSNIRMVKSLLRPINLSLIVPEDWQQHTYRQRLKF